MRAGGGRLWSDGDMTIIKINAITVPEDAGDELARRFADRAGAVDGQDGFEGFELLAPTDGRNQWLVVTALARRGVVRRMGGLAGLRPRPRRCRPSGCPRGPGIRRLGTVVLRGRRRLGRLTGPGRGDGGDVDAHDRATGSATQLARKLGIMPGSVVTLLGTPATLELDLPPGVTLRKRAVGAADVVVTFQTRVSALERRLDALAELVRPAGGLWIAWPKRTSGVETDLTDHEVRRLALPRGLVDNKVCAVDATWTGLRLVWRREPLKPTTLAWSARVGSAP